MISHPCQGHLLLSSYLGHLPTCGTHLSFSGRDQSSCVLLNAHYVLGLGLDVLYSPFLLALTITQQVGTIFISWTSQVALVVKNPPGNAGDIRDTGSIPGSGRSPGGGPSNPLQYFCLENPKDRGTWWATVHGVAKSQTQMKQLNTHTHTHTHTCTHIIISIS